MNDAPHQAGLPSARVTPSAVPRLPILDWHGLGMNWGPRVPSILDQCDYTFTSSGRAAILLGLEALGIGPGDSVLVPTYHCPTMVAPIESTGASAVFYPIGNRGQALLEKVVASQAGRIKAAIVPHFFGIPQDLSAIRAFCDDQGIALIEDCAHSFFGVAGTRTVGHWGDLAIASLTKFFPVPSGGILVSSRKRLNKPSLFRPGAVRQVKALVDIFETAAHAGRLAGLGPLLRALFSMKRAVRASDPGIRGGEVSDVVTAEALSFDVELAHRSPEWVCRIMPALSNQERIVRQRQANYRELSKRLSGYHGFLPLFPDLPDNAVPYVFPLRVSRPDAKYHALKAAGLPVFRWNWLWPGTPHLEGDHGLPWSSEVFQLACHQELTDAELSCICDTVIDVCGE